MRRSAVNSIGLANTLLISCTAVAQDVVLGSEATNEEVPEGREDHSYSVRQSAQILSGGGRGCAQKGAFVRATIRQATLHDRDKVLMRASPGTQNPPTIQTASLSHSRQSPYTPRRAVPRQACNPPQNARRGCSACYWPFQSQRCPASSCQCTLRDCHQDIRASRWH